MMDDEGSIRAVVRLDVRSLDPEAIERLAELVEERIAGRREASSEPSLSVEDVSELTGFSRSLVYREIERGHLRAYKVGTRIRVERTAFEAWKDRCQVRPRSEPPVFEPVMRPRRGGRSKSFVDELDAIERNARRAA